MKKKKDQVMIENEGVLREEEETEEETEMTVMEEIEEIVQEIEEKMTVQKNLQLS